MIEAICKTEKKSEGTEQKARLLFSVLLTIGKVRYPIPKQVVQNWEVNFGQKVDDLLPEMAKNEQISYKKTPTYTVLMSYYEHCPRKVLRVFKINCLLTWYAGDHKLHSGWQDLMAVSPLLEDLVFFSVLFKPSLLLRLCLAMLQMVCLHHTQQRFNLRNISTLFSFTSVSLQQ